MSASSRQRPRWRGWRWVAPALRFSGKALALGFFAALSLALVPVFLAQEEDTTALEELEPLMAPGSAVALLQVAHAGPGGFAFVGGDALIVAEHGGRAMRTRTFNAMAPVAVDPAFDWLRAGNRMSRDAMDFVPSADLHRYRYVLVPPHRSLGNTKCLASLFAPEGRSVAHQGALDINRIDLAPPVHGVARLRGPPRVPRRCGCAANAPTPEVSDGAPPAAKEPSIPPRRC